MAFATEFLARQARQRILYHPDIAAVLDRAGMIPRVGEAADGPRPDQTGAGRTVKGDCRAAARRRQMVNGGVGADIYGGPLMQGCEPPQVEPAEHANHAGSSGPQRLS